MAAQTEEQGYVAKAKLSNIHVSPRKARLVVDMIRGQSLQQALDSLEFCPRKLAPPLKKLLLSAAANAKEQSSVDVDELRVKAAWVDAGRVLKRFMPRAHGRATPIRKRHSSITVVLDEIGA